MLENTSQIKFQFYAAHANRTGTNRTPNPRVVRAVQRCHARTPEDLAFDLFQFGRQILASFAQFSDATRGRQFKEAPPVWRTQFQRDRDRVIHSRAFRRLEYKTQARSRWNCVTATGSSIRARAAAACNN